jgi:maltokinase
MGAVTALLPPADWWRIIGDARWFGGKGLAAELVDLTPLPWYTAAGSWPAVRSEIATVAYADGRTECYQLLAGYLPGERDGAVGLLDDAEYGALSVVDAAAEPSCMTALLHALVGGHPSMEWIDRDAVDPEAPTRVWAGEQSNTTICLGDDRLFKLFRKLEPGRNLDVEVLAALNGSGTTPAMYGALVGDLPAGGRGDLGMLVERVAGVTDGWEWACTALAAGRGIEVEARQLGEALQQVHGRLAHSFGTGVADGAAIAATMVRRLDAAIEQAPRLADLRAGLTLGLSGVAGDLPVQRVHGDFHLGQVLRGADGWTIIDFEGEPLKTLAERRRPDSVWRDVAGMLRSFDYVRGTHADPAANDVVAWADAAGAAFLDGYCGGDVPDRSILGAYELDKAIYEVVYEVRNRPTWEHIPWRAVQDVARRAVEDPSPEKMKEY